MPEYLEVQCLRCRIPIARVYPHWSDQVRTRVCDNCGQKYTIRRTRDGKIYVGRFHEEQLHR